MTVNLARLIREVKRGCTFRRLAEIYYPREHELYGIQMAGEDLCKQALKVLYPGIDVYTSVLRTHFRFKEENMSRLGDFYWWE